MLYSFYNIISSDFAIFRAKITKNSIFLVLLLYIYRKKQLREMDRRIRYLQRRTSEMKVIEHLPNDRDRVFFGATVTLESEAGEISSLRIVGSDEFDFKAEYISVDSPMARALLKKQVDDEVYLRLPSGPSTFYINKIEY